MILPDLSMDIADRDMSGTDWTPIDISVTAKRTRNPIREVVETIHPPATPHKPIIPLSLGTL